MGKVEAIFITPTNGAPLRSVDSVRALAGKGPDGDRNFFPQGSPPKEIDRQITLIEAEAVEGARREYEVELEPESLGLLRLDYD